jgi:exosortase N
MRAIQLKLKHILRGSKYHVYGIVMLIVLVLSSLFNLYNYFNWQSPAVLLVLAMLPMAVLQSGSTNSRGWYLVLLSFLSLMVCVMVPTKTAIYMSLLLGLCWLMCMLQLRISMILLILISILSPMFQYMITSFSIPIRLWLTKMAVVLFQAFGISAKAAGNSILLDNQVYWVDPACMGLSMLAATLALGMAMLVIAQHRYQVRWSAMSVWLLVLLLLLLNIIANLMRIVFLVYWNIPADHFMHEGFGLICFFVYILLPIYFVVQKRSNILMRKASKPVSSPKKKSMRFYRNHQIALSLFLVMFIGANIFVLNHKKTNAIQQLPISKDYTISLYQSEVIKMQNENALIYIKPLKGFVYTDHNPLICWTSEGYAFEQVSEKRYGELSYYTGVLKKDKELFYTAWWYSNGRKTTLNSWLWRWDMFKGQAPYSIVNITSSDAAILNQEIQRFLQEQHNMGLFL